MAERHFMNPAYGRHMGSDGAKPHHGSDGERHGGKPHPHSVHIHHAGDGEPHPGNPHHVHVHHADGSHEHTEHENYSEAMNHAHSIGGESGQDHGLAGEGEDSGDELSEEA